MNEKVLKILENGSQRFKAYSVALHRQGSHENGRLARDVAQLLKEIAEVLKDEEEDSYRKRALMSEDAEFEHRWMV